MGPQLRMMVPLSFPRLLLLLGTGNALDWRHIDPYLPVEPRLIHPKPIAIRDWRRKHGRTIGIPLPFGFRSAHLAQLRREVSYAPHSRGMYCSNDGHPFLFESDHLPEDCVAMCSADPACMSLTVYLQHGWCQLSSRCVEQQPAGDPSSETYVKILGGDGCNGASPPAACFGGWVADLGKPIGPRHS